jgi:hypothetical protein
MKGVYLNVLGVVVLAEPSNELSMETPPDPAEIHGVDHLPRLADAAQMELAAASEGGTEGRNEVIEIF